MAESFSEAQGGGGTPPCGAAVRLAVSERLAVACGLAVSEALLDLFKPSDCEEVLWLHLWRPRDRAIVLGSASRCQLDVAPGSAELGLDLYRRVSGGGTVVLGPETWCYSFIWPRSIDPGSIAASFKRVHGVLREALSRLGLSVRSEAVSDLVVEQAGGVLRKIAGHAQKRRKHATLCEGSLLAEPFPFPMESALTHPQREPAYRKSRRHDQFVTTLAQEHVAASFMRFVEAVAFSVGNPQRVALPECVLGEVERLVAEKYHSPAWTKRL